MGNCLFLCFRGWGIDRQVRKKLQIPGGMPGGGMVTGRIEPCIKRTELLKLELKRQSSSVYTTSLSICLLVSPDQIKKLF